MIVADYIRELNREFANGDSTEHTHRPALKRLLEGTQRGIQATNEPRQRSHNAPDFVVRRGTVLIGHVEAKDIGTVLERALQSDQLRRYCEALPNLILTDYLTFTWIRAGQVQRTVQLAHQRGRKIVVVQGAEEAWLGFATAFFTEVAPVTSTPRELAQLLAGQARLLRMLSLELLEKRDTELTSWKTAFSEVLVPEMSDEEFSTMFAQTVAYGLFTARVFDASKETFTLHEAESLIPKANPFLRKFFHFVASPDLSDGIRWMIEQIVHVLQRSDMESIVRAQGRRVGFEDPVFHFYETFLNAYDPQLREKLGVYYTPRPVVDFIVRSVDYLLKDTFGKSQGLADPATCILDPGVGTATFLSRAIDLIYAQQVARGLGGAWQSYVVSKLIPRVFGFELLMAPYTIAHLRLELQLAESGVAIPEGTRLNIFLTNTLDQFEAVSNVLFARWLSEESRGADRVKREVPVEVVMGNPPYSGESHNKSAWIMELMNDYKKEADGSKLKEKNTKWINADENKFIRFAHWRIARTGYGIVALIAPHNWLDAPTLRGMRASIWRDFDEIFVLDLHGNANKGETTPAALSGQGEDKNVFDITQGVAVVFLVRRRGPKGRSTGKVFWSDIWGRREFKYEWLSSTSFEKVPWIEVETRPPLLPFCPTDWAKWDAFERGWLVTDIFPTNGTGIVTKCDDLNIHWSADEMWEVVQWFRDATEDQVRARFKVPKPSVRDWKHAWALEDIIESGPDRKWIARILYRPFDHRYVYYTGQSRGLMGWPVRDLMQHFELEGNIALLTTRLTKGESFAHALVTDCMHENICLSSKTSNNAFAFPLWLKASSSRELGFEDKNRQLNFNPNFLHEIAKALHVAVEPPYGLPKGVTAEMVFAYIYAILHSTKYRTRFADVLKASFPRIPLPRSIEAFMGLAGLGHELVQLHLFRRSTAQARTWKFPVDGDSVVQRVEFAVRAGETLGRVYINECQYFDGIETDHWNHMVGGYRVLDKWLRVRRGRRLSHDEVEAYLQLVDVVDATQARAHAIDELFVV